MRLPGWNLLTCKCTSASYQADSRCLVVWLNGVALQRKKRKSCTCEKGSFEVGIVCVLRGKGDHVWAPQGAPCPEVWVSMVASQVHPCSSDAMFCGVGQTLSLQQE